jgi:hypothetical protein
LGHGIDFGGGEKVEIVVATPRAEQAGKKLKPVGHQQADERSLAHPAGLARATSIAFTRRSS